MTDDNLRFLVGGLQNRNSKADAFFGVYMTSQNSKKTYIRANRQGLELFAIELLNVSLDTEKILSNPETDFAIINQEYWVDEDSDYFIQHISPSIDKKGEPKYLETKSTWKDKLKGYLAILFLIFLLACMIIGLVQVLKWIF